MSFRPCVSIVGESEKDDEFGEKWRKKSGSTLVGTVISNEVKKIEVIIMIVYDCTL